MPSSSRTWEFLLDENLPKGLWKALRAARYPKDMHYPCRIWQSDYYERVVRIAELEQTRHYIRTNPTKLSP